MPKQDSVDRRPLAIFLVVLIAAISAVVVWMNLGGTASLNEDGYAVTMALYRVCNQRDEEGLQKVEEMLASLTTDESGVDSQKEIIVPIVVEARAGNWDEAMQACRDLMDAQVKS